MSVRTTNLRGLARPSLRPKVTLSEAPVLCLQGNSSGRWELSLCRILRTKGPKPSPDPGDSRKSHDLTLNPPHPPPPRLNFATEAQFVFCFPLQISNQNRPQLGVGTGPNQILDQLLPLKTFELLWLRSFIFWVQIHLCQVQAADDKRQESLKSSLGTQTCHTWLTAL